MVPNHAGYNILPNTVRGSQNVFTQGMLTSRSPSSVGFFGMRVEHLCASRLSMSAQITRGRTWSSCQTC
jgi:hypothetical protein